MLSLIVIVYLTIVLKYIFFSKISAENLLSHFQVCYSGSNNTESDVQRVRDTACEDANTEDRKVWCVCFPSYLSSPFSVFYLHT